MQQIEQLREVVFRHARDRRRDEAGGAAAQQHERTILGVRARRGPAHGIRCGERPSAGKGVISDDALDRGMYGGSRFRRHAHSARHLHRRPLEFRDGGARHGMRRLAEREEMHPSAGG
jgi:hypothetical protein